MFTTAAPRPQPRYTIDEQRTVGSNAGTLGGNEGRKTLWKFIDGSGWVVLLLTDLKRCRCGKVTFIPPTLTTAFRKPTARRLAWSLRGSITASSCTVVVSPLQPLYTARFVSVLEGKRKGGRKG